MSAVALPRPRALVGATSWCAHGVLALLATFLLLALGGCGDARAARTIFVGANSSGFVDKTGTLQIDDVVRHRATLFKPGDGIAPNEGISGTTRAHFWLNVPLPALPDLLREGWSAPLVLSVKEARIAHVDLFIMSPSGLRSFAWDSGDTRRLSGEGFRYPVFFLSLDMLRDADVYLRISTVSSMQGLVWLSDFQSFFGQYDKETLTQSVLLGVMCAIFIYILALGLFLRNGPNLWLASSILSGMVYIVCANAFLETVVVPGATTLSRVLGLVATLTLCGCFLGFTSAFLRLKRRIPRLHTILSAGAGVLIVVAALSISDFLFDIGIFRRVSTYLDLGCIVLALTAAAIAAFRWPGRSFLFLVAWLPALAAGGLRLFHDALPQLGVGPTVEYSILTGFTLSLIFFTILASVDIRQRERRLKDQIVSNFDRFRAFAEIGTDIFWEIDRQGRLTFLSGKDIAKASFATGGPFLDRLAELSTADFVRPLREVVAARQPFDDRRLRIGEEDHWLSISGRPIAERDRHGRANGAVYRGLLRDVSVDVEREGRRVLEQQMFALGQLAGSVAHEINNLIHPVINLTKRLRQRNKGRDDPEGDRMMDLIDMSSRQAAKVVSELLQTTRGERWKDVNRPIGSAVEHSVEAVRPALPSSVRVDLVVEDLDQPTVKIGDVLQIIGNLISNAVHAMDGAGTISVALARAETGVRLSIGDDGAGMDDAVRRRAIQPFFTTKTDGRGTGVGLYIVNRIVQDYGGWITIESALGRGTTVTLFFPYRKDQNGNLEASA